MYSTWRRLRLAFTESKMCYREQRVSICAYPLTQRGLYLAVEAFLVDDAQILRLLAERVRVVPRGDGEVHLGEDDELLAGQLQLLDRFAEHNLGQPVGIYLSSDVRVNRNSYIRQR